MRQLRSNQASQKDELVDRLYQRYWLTLFTIIRQSIPRSEDAEDILLDVFLAALENPALAGMNERYQEAWLRRVTYNKCMDFHRRLARRPALPLEGHTETLHDEMHAMPEHAALHHEEREQLQKHFSALPEDQQELLRLRFGEEMACAQIAVRLHKSEGAIRTMLSRTLNRLRVIYTQQKEDHDGK